MWAIGGGSARSHARFTIAHGFSSPLLIDPKLAVARAYGATIGFGPLRIVRRATVGIARDGTIAFARSGAMRADGIVTAFG